MKNRKLTIELKNEELVIRIGIDTLKFACEHAQEEPLCQPDNLTGNYLTYKVIDTEKFAKDVIDELLLEEEEDGTTKVHLLLDKAMFSAIENGSMAIGEDMIEVK